MDSGLRPRYYEPQVDSTVTQEEKGCGTSSSTSPRAAGAGRYIDVRVEGPREDPLFRRILRRLPLKSGDPLNHKAYEDIVRPAAHRRHLRLPDARLVRNELIVIPNHTANIVLQLDTGTRYRFGKTTITQHVVGDSPVRRHLRYKEGEYFDLT